MPVEINIPIILYFWLLVHLYKHVFLTFLQSINKQYKLNKIKKKITEIPQPSPKIFHRPPTLGT